MVSENVLQGDEEDEYLKAVTSGKAGGESYNLYADSSDDKSAATAAPVTQAAPAPAQVKPEPSIKAEPAAVAPGATQTGGQQGYPPQQQGGQYGGYQGQQQGGYSGQQGYDQGYGQAGGYDNYVDNSGL
jgi:hypothetical protein